MEARLQDDPIYFLIYQIINVFSTPDRSITDTSDARWWKRVLPKNSRFISTKGPYGKIRVSGFETKSEASLERTYKQTVFFPDIFDERWSRSLNQRQASDGERFC